ncbi:MAG: hypothetical protein DRH17_00275 [Deltaproteobacteria bacterium]|nr:MAG: hypothetical protein DRH17_00275 [Deltaproteobacteria bacterium]
MAILAIQRLFNGLFIQPSALLRHVVEGLMWVGVAYRMRLQAKYRGRFQLGPISGRDLAPEREVSVPPRESR